MKNKIHYSPKSLEDLNEIWDYISNEINSAGAAKNTITGITKTIERLEDFAEIGAPLSGVIKIENGYRFLVSGHYMIFYRTVEKNIYIDRILYGKRDYLSILFGNKEKE